MFARVIGHFFRRKPDWKRTYTTAGIPLVAADQLVKGSKQLWGIYRFDEGCLCIHCQTTDWYQYTGSEFQYLDSTTQYWSETYYVPYDGGGGYGSYSNYDWGQYGTAGSMPLLIINHLTGKANCVYGKLKIGSSTFKNAIQKFDGQFPVAHLKFSLDYTLASTTNAETDNSGEYHIEIKINGNTLSDRTVLGLARTLAHEIIHAEMYRKLRSVGYTVSINDFPGIYYYYSQYKDWQHEQMAAHYRETIVDILREFDNSQHTDQFYDDLSWVGLQRTVSWSSLSGSDTTRIIQTVQNNRQNGNKNCN
ncbi:hypothetical protein [Algoriphagus sp. Y33]|uniref:hypothetical protein n=1 Tax=Algoriphagus sp. Y33 TaxID=2772483 RepID=UPI00177E4417|nr:hypothetical protein [Algoriphagus sp. Y33]